MDDRDRDPRPDVGGQPPGVGASARKASLAMLALVWCTFVVTVYCVSHKPANPRQLQALAALGVTLVGWGGTIAMAHGLARRIAPVIGVMPIAQRLALRIGLGLGVISLTTLALGALGALWRWLPWAVIVVTAPFTFPALWSDLRELLRPPIRGGASRLLALFIGASLVLAVLPALAPPTAWDALVYHLTGPKLYIAAGRLVHNVDIPHLGFPQAAEMLFTWGMLLSGPQTAQLFHASFAVLTLLLLGSITECFASGRGWLAAALLAAVPSGMIIAGWAYVEWMTMFGALAALVLLVRAVESRGEDPRASSENSNEPGQSLVMGTVRFSGDIRAEWILAGFFAAQALSTKYTALGVVVGLTAFAVWRLRPWRGVVVFSASAGICTVPYLLKNLFLTGNPFYPFFLPGVFWDTLRQNFYSRPGTGLDALRLLLAPWDVTIWGIEGGFAVGHPSYAATIGPLLLALMPFVLLKLGNPTRRHPWLWAFILASGVMYLSWIFGLASSHLLLQSRLLFPALPMFVALAVIGYDALDRLEWPGFSIRYVVGGLVGIVLCLTLASSILGFIQDNPLKVITGAESQERYEETHLGMYAWAIDRINLLPPGSRVVFLWEPRSFGCSTSLDCEPDDITDRWWHMRRLGKTASDVAAEWRARGVTHILYYAYGAKIIRQAGVDPYTEEDWGELQKLIDDDLEEVERWGEAYVLYRLR